MKVANIMSVIYKFTDAFLWNCIVEIICQYSAITEINDDMCIKDEIIGGEMDDFIRGG